MPRYDYQCVTCGATFEANQRMSDAPLTACGCGKNGEVQRLLSAGSGLIFKGSGFYITDYKNGSASGAPASETAAPAKSEAPAASPAAAPSGPACGAGACGACSD
jgi:putative FmdB family regulatory protein